MEQIKVEISALLAQIGLTEELQQGLLPLVIALLITISLRRLRRRFRRRPAGLPLPFEIDTPYVIDGDTIAKGDLRIRLFGIDAPERGQRQGKAATRHLRQLIAKGPIRVIPRDIDRYGRLVAQIMVGETDICRKMVADGYAVACTDYTSLYAAQQSRARRRRVGLWRYGAIQNPTRYRRQHG